MVVHTAEQHVWLGRKKKNKQENWVHGGYELNDNPREQGTTFPYTFAVEDSHNLYCTSMRNARQS